MRILFLILTLAPLTDIYQIFAIGRFGVVSSDLLMAVLYFIFIKQVFWDSREIKIRYDISVLFFLGLIAAVLISGLNPLIDGSGSQILQYFKTSVHYLYLCFIIVVVLVVPINAKTWDNIIRTWIVVSIFVNVFGVYQIFARAFDLPLAWIEITNVSYGGRDETSMSEFSQLSLRFGNFYRATSIFSEPSSLASYNIVTLIYLIIPYVQNRNPFFNSRLINTVAFITALVGLFLTFSMTGVLGVVSTAIAILIFNRSQKLVRFVWVFVISLVMILASDSLMEKYLDNSVIKLFEDRISGLVNYGSKGNRETAGESVSGRLMTMDKAVAIWKDNMIIGQGMGLASFHKGTDLNFADSAFFHILAELGIIGGFMFAGMCAALLWQSILMIRRGKHREEKEGLTRLEGLFMYLLLHLFMVNFMTGNNFVRPSFWISLTMAFSVIAQSQSLNVKKITIILWNKLSLKERYSKALTAYLKK